MDTEGQAVRFRDCACPGTPHDGLEGADDGDIVWLRPVLPWGPGAEALRLILESVVIVANTGGGPKGEDPLLDDSRVAETVGPIYVRHGVARWNVVDEDGPVPYDAEAILVDYTLAYPVVEVANQLYTEKLIDPLVKRMSVSSGRGSSVVPIRQTRRSSASRHSPRPSSSQKASAGPRSVTGP